MVSFSHWTLALLYLPSLHPCMSPGEDACVGSVLKTVQLTQQRALFLSSIPFGQHRWQWITHWPCSPKWRHYSLPRAAPHISKSHNLWPQANHSTSLCSPSLLPKHFLLSWWSSLAIWGIPRKSRSCFNGIRYYSCKLPQVAKILWGWIYILLNMSKCMNIHGKNTTLQGFVHIFFRYYITWRGERVVFVWLMVIIYCCKLKHHVICSLTA